MFPLTDHKTTVRAASVLLLCALAASSGLAAGPTSRAATLSLNAAITEAIETDPWLSGSRQTETALHEQAIAASSLPDPELSLRAMNLPTDSFSIHEENMTQLAVGISQRFPRGRTRTLSRQQMESLAAAETMLRADRRARLAAQVSALYLDAFLAQASSSLINSDRTLFEQLVDAAEVNYASGAGRARQQDLIRAQLELTRLDDRLTMLRQTQESAQQRLAEFSPSAAHALLASSLPDLGRQRPDASPTQSADAQVQIDDMRLHPAVLAVERQIDSVSTAVDLARQKYRPAWGLTAQYGYRADTPGGQDRNDLLSVGVTFDLPLFRSNRQDREVNAAVARESAAWTDRTLLLRQMAAQLESARADLARLGDRQALYRRQLLPQMSQQAEASLTAYNNTDGDFAEAVRARIAELNAKIDALAIDVSRQKVLARLNYLTTRVPMRAGATPDGGQMQ